MSKQVVDGKADLEFTVKVDLMPDFELTDVSKLEVERLIADVDDADVDEALKRLAEQTRTYCRRAGRRGGRKGRSSSTIDFVGSIDGVNSKAARARISI